MAKDTKFKENNKQGNRFSSENQPKRKNGRKPNIYKQLAAMVGEKFKLELTKSDFIRIQQWLLEMPLSQLKAIIKDPETPSFMVVHISALMSDAKNGKTDSVEKIYDRVYGKAMQPVEMEASVQVDKEIDMSAYSDEDLEMMTNLIEKSKVKVQDEKHNKSKEDTGTPNE